MVKVLINTLRAIPVTILALLILNSATNAVSLKYKPSSRLTSLLCCIVFVIFLVAFIALV